MNGVGTTWFGYVSNALPAPGRDGAGGVAVIRSDRWRELPPWGARVRVTIEENPSPYWSLVEDDDET